ncbi:MAG: lipid A deacylase LpxR family protein [Gemmatimonadetes bacterium]|nr:lipid A deacylase LpxR family protein [Gemmatimonadota bacterium]
MTAPRIPCHHPVPNLGRITALLLASALLASPGAAQVPRDSANAGPVANAPGTTARRNSPWLPRLRLENDAYNFWIHPGHRSDEEFSNGVVASFETLRGTFWGRRLAPATPDCGADTSSTGRCLTTGIAIGQEMYTPNLQRPPFSSPSWRDERPYAGWLWAGLTGRSVSRRSLRQLDAVVGVTGPPALGQLSQQIAHTINASYTTRARGWETQVGFQPGLQVGYSHALLALRGRVGTKAFLDLVPQASATLGTVRTAVESGARLRLGYNLSHPFDPRRWVGRTPLEYWVSAGGRAAWVARDFSLDGSILGDERRVDRVPGVRDYTFGAGLRMHRVLLTWEATTRSRQYTTGPLHHTYSTMSASWEFYR